MAVVIEPDLRSNKGQREYLTDLISVVDAKDTPFTSMAKKGAKPGNTLIRWQVDGYAAASSAGIVDGIAVDAAGGGSTTDHTTERAELANYVQIFRRAVRTSVLTEEVHNAAGVKSELARGVSKKMVELKRDLELTFLSDNVSVLGTNAVAYKTRGLGRWTDPALANAADALWNNSNNSYRTASAAEFSGTTANLTEADIQGVLKGLFDSNGTIKTYDLICGSALKRAFTGLTTPVASGTNQYPSLRTFNKELDDKAFRSNIQVFEGDFGTLRLHPCTFTPDANRGYAIPFDLVSICFSKYATVKPLTNDGQGEGRYIETIAALCVGNPLGFGRFAGA